MAAKKKSNEPATINRKKIWEQLPNEAWLKVAGEYRKSHQFTSVSAKRIKGKCILPGHADSDPSFFIDTEAHYAKCFGCQRHLNDPIEIMQHMLGADKLGTITYLRDKLAVTVLSKKAEQELEAQQKDQLMKREIYDVTHSCLCDAIADPTNPDHLYAQPIINWLENARGIPRQVMHQLPLGVLPTVNTVALKARQRYTTKLRAFQQDQSGLETPIDVSAEVNEYIRKYAGVDSPQLIGSLVFPLHSSISEISRFKFRTLINGTDRNFLITDNTYGDTVGLFGLGWEPYASFLLSKGQSDEVYITEGEFDALTVMLEAVKNNKTPTIPLLSAGGAGAAGDIEPILRSAGISKAYLIPDSPSKQGDSVVAEWCKNIRSLKIRIFDAWGKLPGKIDSDGNEQGHDLDSAVAAYGQAKVNSIVADTDGGNYTSPGRWFFDRAVSVIDATADDSLRTRLELASIQGRNVKHRLDREEFIDLISRHYDLSVPQLARELSAKEDTQLGFIQQCIDAILRKFFVVGHKLVGGKRVLVLYSKTKQTLHEITLGSEDAITREFAPLCGTLVSFVERYVGFPSFIENPNEADMTNYKQVDLNLRMYMREALLSLAEGAPDMFGTRLRQGYHVMKKSTERIEYIVEGPNVIKIERSATDPTHPTFRFLEGPADQENNIVFDLTDKDDQAASHWYPGGIKLNDFQSPDVKGVDLKKLFTKLYTLYSTGFKYKHQDVTAKLLAAITMTLPIQDVFNRPAYMFISGDSRSGKSTLTSLLAGSKNEHIRILYCSHMSDNTTFAGITRTADRTTKLLVLDEFESSDTTSKEKQVNAILEVFRPLVNGVAIRTLSSPQGGGVKDQIFKQATIYVAIGLPAKTQDANRMLNIELKAVPSHKIPIESLIPQNFTKQELDVLRRELNLGMFQYATVLADTQSEISDTLFDLQKKFPTYMDSRLTSAFIAPLTIMKLAFGDAYWKKYMEEYVNAFISDIEQTAQTTESEALLSSMLRNPCIRLETGDISIAYLLATSELRSDINRPATGCYYDQSTQLLLILMDVAITRLLSIENRKYGRTVHQLKAVLDRHPKALTSEEIEASGILMRTGSTLGAGIKAKDVCVLRVDAWLKASTTATSPQAFVNTAIPTDIAKDVKALAEAGAYAVPLPPPDDN